MKTATWFQVTLGFLPAFKVFWRSLLQHNPRELFGDVIVQTNEWIDELEGDDFKQRPFALNRYHGWPAFEPRIVNCYAKLEALECIEYDQILVLDCDMVCTGSIADIFEQSESFVGVGIECAENDRRRHNGGLWLGRPPVIGNPHVHEVFARWARVPGKFFDKCDQSAMVVYLEDFINLDRCLLPARFNLQIGFAEDPKLRPIYYDQRDDCRILHFTGPAKPWVHEPPAMRWRERFRPLWERAERGEKLTAKDVVEVEIE